jgi:hypothetical protein
LRLIKYATEEEEKEEKEEEEKEKEVEDEDDEEGEEIFDSACCNSSSTCGKGWLKFIS